MALQNIRYGIIGCGSMGREHIENIRAMPATQVTAIADTHADSRDKAQELLGQDARVFTHYRELLSSGLCDAVVVATPNFTHAEILRDCLRTGLHILAEKPVCTRVEDAHALVQQRRNTATCRRWLK